jgi:hypothetical protein
MALGDGIRRNIAQVDPVERALFRDASCDLPILAVERLLTSAKNN